MAFPETIIIKPIQNNYYQNDLQKLSREKAAWQVLLY
jgi:hypothetical protein